MTLKNALAYFEGLKDGTSNKSEIRIYGKFLHILGELNRREFSKDEIRSIETELDTLSLATTPRNRKRYFRKALAKFEKYLRDSFSFTPKGYYTNVGIALGSSFGVLVGVLFLFSLERSLGISYGIGIGLLIGIFVGRYMDAQAKAAGNLI